MMTATTLRRSLVTTTEYVVVISLSLATALWLRLSVVGFPIRDLLAPALVLSVPVKLATFLAGGLYTRSEGTPLSDFVRTFVVNLFASVLATVAIYYWIGPEFPRAAFLLDFMVCFTMCILVRLLRMPASGSRNPAAALSDTTPQPPRERFASILLTLSTFLLCLSVLLGATVYRLVTRSTDLNDLTSMDRQRLVESAYRISPQVFQPFPLSGRPLFWRMSPNTRYENVLGDTFTTNDLGFRTISTTKPAGFQRIVLVGDSWTYGQGVHFQETFARQLEGLINRTEKKWQVYDLAMSGWNTENEIAALRAYFSTLQPDLVVFFPTANDIDDRLDVWNGQILNDGADFRSAFRHSYMVQTRWIRLFQSLQGEVVRLKQLKVPAIVCFIGASKMFPYYASLSDFNVTHLAVPPRYFERQYRLSADVDPGEHANAQGHELIAGYLYNALVTLNMIRGLAPLPGEPATIQDHGFDRHAVESQLEDGLKSLRGRDLIPLAGDFMGREGLFSLDMKPTDRTVRVAFSLLDDAGLYPLTVRVKLESSEESSIEHVFEQFTEAPKVVELEKPSSLDTFPVVEVRVTVDHVIANGPTAVSMKRPRFQAAR